MNFLNSPYFAPAANRPGDPSFKRTIMNYAKKLDASSLSSLSGKYGSDLFYATIYNDPEGHKAIIEEVKAEIDALLEVKRARETMLAENAVRGKRESPKKRALKQEERVNG